VAELAPEVARPDVGDGREDLAHYARNDELAQARREGRAVKALCGTLFHPGGGDATGEAAAEPSWFCPAP